jgi:hypothetical protein
MFLEALAAGSGIVLSLVVFTVVCGFIAASLQSGPKEKGLCAGI